MLYASRRRVGDGSARLCWLNIRPNMSTALISGIKSLEGQPWSSWSEYLGFILPPDFCNDLSRRSNHAKRGVSGTMRLNKADMGIYGLYPGAETFELAVCEFCGDKFKLAALTEHIDLRHKDGKKIPAVDITSLALSNKAKLLQLHLKKGKQRAPKSGKDQPDKPLTSSSPKIKAKTHTILEEKPKPVVINEPLKTDSAEIKIMVSASLTNQTSKCSTKVNPSPPSTVLKQDSSKIKHIKLKLRKPKEVCENNNQIVKAPPKLVKNPSILSTSSTNPSNTSISVSTSILKNKDKPKQESLVKKCVTKSEQQCLPQQKTPEPPVIKPSEELAKMQPVVQLSQLDCSQTLSKAQSVEQKKKVKNDKKLGSLKERMYNPDRHCGVVGKENAKPCTRSLTCKSHSMSSRRAVRGRSKAFDILLADHRAEKEMCKKPVASQTSLTEVRPALEANIVYSPDSDSINIVESVEVRKLKPKPTRNLISDYSRLSLPVSIKNPNIFTQLQNQNEKISPFSPPAVSNGTVSNTVKLLGQSSILKKQVLNSVLTKNEALNSQSFIKPFQPHLPNLIQPPSTVSSQKTPTIEVEVFQQWYPGFRRNGGLLYSNNNFPKVNVTNLTMVDNIFNENIISQLIPSINNTELHSKNKYMRVNASHFDDIKQFPVLAFEKKKLATLVPKCANNIGKTLLSTLEDKKWINIAPAPIVNKQNTIVSVMAPKRASESHNSYPTKRLKRNAKVNVIGAMFNKTISGTALMRLSFPPGLHNKEVQLCTTQPILPARNVQTGVSLLENNSFRISTPQRVHYITSSGPLPITLQPISIIPQG